MVSTPSSLSKIIAGTRFVHDANRVCSDVFKTLVDIPRSCRLPTYQTLHRDDSYRWVSLLQSVESGIADRNQNTVTVLEPAAAFAQIEGSYGKSQK
jgi:hypothetical protein